MIIPTPYFNMIVYLYANESDAKTNNTKNGGGTGFLFSSKLSTDSQHDILYIVSNAHILEALENMGATHCTVRINTNDGSSDVIQTKISEWVRHKDGDDVAVYYLPLDSKWKCDFISRDMLIKEDYVRTDIFGDQESPEVAEIDIDDNEENRNWREVRKIGIGTDTIMVGRFMKHGGNDRNYPVVRRGHIAMLPFEPIMQTSRNYNQQSFLVETYSIGGFSGSPVFVQTALNKRNKRHDDTSNGTTYGQGVFLLGIDWGHFDFEGEIVKNDASSLKIPSGMMCVVPAWKLDELIRSIEVK